MIDDQCPLSD